MQKLTRADLFSLEQYAEQRPEFRQRVMAHKKPRRIALGEHLSLCFEDRMTMQYQVQEMLRVERIFEVVGIEEEIAAYNPMIPDGSNWKATLMIEYSDISERDVALKKLVGIEDQVVFRIGDNAPLACFPDEDIERSREQKTAAVHFMRYELTVADREALAAGAPIIAAVEHVEYPIEPFELSAESRDSLIADLALAS